MPSKAGNGTPNSETNPNPERRTRTTRRRFLFGFLLAASAMAVADAKWVEPGWLKVRRVRLKSARGRHRLVHFTDLHHKGDRALLSSLARKINALAPDSVCFTGDLVEDKQYLAEALDALTQIQAPLYGVPGNHDYWSKLDFKNIAAQFARTGGRWLMDDQQMTADGQLSIIGATCVSLKQPALKLNPATRNIVLMHYPAWVKKFGPQTFDLLLAGHSHGGQVRFPLYGPVHIPFGVDQYDMGLFQTESGPLYVNPGIGWFLWPVRFNCRPEITVFEL